MNKLIIFFCFLFFSTNEKTQKTDPIPITKNMIHKGDTATISSFSKEQIYNAKVLESFFEKLQHNENHNNNKINVVHIGDSHIQGDLMTNEIRKRLQYKFGNAGRGFVFPYQLAKTNGSYNERFHSSRVWESYRNIYPVRDIPVGLSGIALWRDNGGFVVELNVKDSDYKFNSIHIITPQNQDMFDLATSSQTNTLQTTERKIIVHKIKKGEALSIIAEKYSVSVLEIKSQNHLKSNAIREGRTLKITTNEMRPKTISVSNFISLDVKKDSFSHFYNSDKPLDRIFLIPNKSASNYELNGLILEKDTSGLIYSSIGVNGAKFSDYNKYPLFFEQLKALHPDLLVFSLGTNESFDKMDTASYIFQLHRFIDNLKAQNINVPIIILTPPPSLFKGRKLNTIVADYAKEILQIADTDGFAVWDLYNEFGGLHGVRQLKAEGLIGPDYVHYSKKGYERQAKLFTEALLKAYNNFKLKK